MKSLRVQLAAVAVLALAAGTTLSGCNQEPTTDTSEGKMTTIQVGVSPGAGTSAPMHWAVEQGKFKERGLDVELQPSTDGAVVIPQLLNGQLDYAMTSFESLLGAADKKLPLKLVVPVNQTPGASEYAGMIVSADDDSGDLAAVKTLAVQDAAKNPLMQKAVEALGGEYADMTMLQTPLGSIADAVASGSADAGYLFQPALGEALKNPKVKLLSYDTEAMTQAGAPGATFIASDKKLAADSEQAKAFIEAVRETYTYAEAHREEISAFTKSAGLTDTAVPVASLPAYTSGQMPLQNVQDLIDLYSTYGFIPAPLKAEDLIWADGKGFK